MKNTEKGLRTDYRYFQIITTRWMDNDIYGHINNVAFYSYFDSIANQFLIKEGGLDIHHSPIVGLVVSSGCNYYSPIAYPSLIEGGFRVNRLGNSSVEYGLAVFKKGETQAVAEGHFVHVFVNKLENKSVPIPTQLRAALEKVLFQP